MVHLAVIHDVTGYLLVILVNRLDVDADGMIAHSAGHGQAAVTQAEVDVGAPLQRRLATRVVDELWQLPDAVLLFQRLLQQAVGGKAQALVALVAVAQGILPPLLTDREQRLLQVKVVDMFVDVNQLLPLE